MKWSVSHLLHTRQLSHVRALLYERCNVEGEVLYRLIYLDIVLSSGCGPDPVVVFLQSAEQTHARLRVRPTPVLAHALFPQIPQGLLPVIVKEWRDLGKMRVFHRLDIFTQLLQSECGLGFAVRIVKNIHLLPGNT